MTTARKDEKEPAPPCPSCGSPNTLATAKHFGEQLFFCAECEHSWSIHPGRPRPGPAKIS